MKSLRGLSAFPITPSDASGRIDLTALRAVVAPLIAAGTDSIGLLGSTGSYPYLSRAERRRALEAAIEEATGRVPVLVGVGALREVGLHRRAGQHHALAVFDKLLDDASRAFGRQALERPVGGGVDNDEAARREPRRRCFLTCCRSGGLSSRRPQGGWLSTGTRLGLLTPLAVG